MAASAYFSFKLAAAGYTDLTIYDHNSNLVGSSAGLGGPETIVDNGDGTYYCPNLSSAYLTVKKNSVNVNGLVNVPFSNAALLDHLNDSTPHSTELYTKTEVDGFFEGESGGKKTVSYNSLTSVPSTFAPSSHDSDHAAAFCPGASTTGAELPTLLSHISLDSDGEGTIYYQRSGAGTTGVLYAVLKNSSDAYKRIRITDAAGSAPAVIA